jgi:UDP-N-acetylglucosamine--N-acetylmuramyl-(pentapeptide) pyrophosphoryl-undecaprenol N-acetylglucosamine transferase
VYPALAVLQALESKLEAVLWVGTRNGMEADLVKNQSIPYAEIPAAGVHGVGLRALPGNLFKLFQGIFASRQILKQFKPDVLLFTGGYLAAPMAIASLKIPSLLYVPDIEPGLAIKFIAGFSKKIAITNENSYQFFKNKSKLEITGYPTRADFSSWTEDNSKNLFNLNNNQPVILFLGGSRGARSINNALINILPDLLTQVQIIHISGKLDWETVQIAKNQLTDILSANYHIAPYLHDEMGAALNAADLVVSRAGASSLGEYPLFGLPAILIPYPHAWRYQKVNAEYLITNHAAVMVKDEDLSQSLLSTIKSLLDHPEKLEVMRTAMTSLAKPNAANHISDLLLVLGSPAFKKEASQ